MFQLVLGLVYYSGLNQFVSFLVSAFTNSSKKQSLIVAKKAVSVTRSILANKIDQCPFLAVRAIDMEQSWNIHVSKLFPNSRRWLLPHCMLETVPGLLIDIDKSRVKALANS